VKLKLEPWQFQFVSKDGIRTFNSSLEELMGYLQCAWLVLFPIKARTDKAEPAFIKVVNSGWRGICPMTGNPVEIDFDPDDKYKGQRIAFYCLEDDKWWLSLNSGYSWMILPSSVFCRVIHKVDAII
jgi:hypothetical protein